MSQVVKANNGSTAWSDKHTAAYRWLQGPSNTSIDTYYSPEVASLDSSNMSYAAYDAVKVCCGGRRMHFRLHFFHSFQRNRWLRNFPRV